MGKSTGLNRYQLLIERIFERRWSKGLNEFDFERGDLESTALELGITLPKNLGDVMYALRYRISFPESILATQPKDREWVLKAPDERAIDSDWSKKRVSCRDPISHGSLFRMRRRS